MKRFSSTTLKTAFVKSIPIFCSYVFVSMAYGMMMASAGFFLAALPSSPLRSLHF